MSGLTERESQIRTSARFMQRGKYRTSAILDLLDILDAERAARAPLEARVAALEAVGRDLLYHASEIVMDHEDATMLHSEWAEFAEAVDAFRAALASPVAPASGEDR